MGWLPLAYLYRPFRVFQQADGITENQSELRGALCPPTRIKPVDSLLNHCFNTVIS